MKIEKGSKNVNFNQSHLILDMFDFFRLLRALFEVLKAFF